MDADEIINPKKTLQRREDEAENGKKGKNAGDLDGPAKDMFAKPMSQSDFGGYGKKKTPPPAELLKKRESRE